MVSEISAIARSIIASLCVCFFNAEDAEVRGVTLSNLKANSEIPRHGRRICISPLVSEISVIARSAFASLCVLCV